MKISLLEIKSIVTRGVRRYVTTHAVISLGRECSRLTIGFFYLHVLAVLDKLR